jgi:hypothetical protein
MNFSPWEKCMNGPFAASAVTESRTYLCRNGSKCCKVLGWTIAWTSLSEVNMKDQLPSLCLFRDHSICTWILPFPAKVIRFRPAWKQRVPRSAPTFSEKHMVGIAFLEEKQWRILLEKQMWRTGKLSSETKYVLLLIGMSPCDKIFQCVLFPASMLCFSNVKNSWTKRWSM